MSPDSRITPVPLGKATFLDAPRCEDLSTLDADVAILGVPFGYPYDLSGLTSPSASAPAALREASVRMAPFITHYDYDFGADIFNGRTVRIVDCGDVAMTPGDFPGNFDATTVAVKAILDRGAVPIILGGDHAIPIPVFQAYEGQEPMVVVQLDQHIDWRQERNGVSRGLSSTMRRASEMPWVNGMAQVGLHMMGSARQGEVDDAVAWGSVHVRAEDIHEKGVDWVLDHARELALPMAGSQVEVLGPASAPMERRAGHYRGQLLLHAATHAPLQRLFAAWLPALEALPDARRVRWSLDVDPLELF